MNTQEFWSIIDRSQSGADRQRQLDLLSQELRSLSQYEYQSLVEHFCKLTDDLRHRDEIVNAAYLAYEECISSDTLDYFCWWLVSMGQSTFAEIATNPDVITDLMGIHKDPNFEEFGAMVYCRNDELMPFEATLQRPKIRDQIWPSPVLEKRLPRLFANK